MASNPRVSAILRPAIDALNPPERIARERALDLGMSQDGYWRGERVKGSLPDHVLPSVAAEQVSVDGVAADDLQAMIDAIPTNYAPTNATFIVQTPNSTLTAEQALSALSTGLVKVTTTTGVLSTATANTDYLPVASPTATGTLTAANLTTTGDNTLGNGATDITLVQGHMKHTGTNPSIAVGAALGTGGSVGASITGTGHVGELVVTAGTTSLTTGTAATITFATARPDTNYAVLITPRASTPAANTVQVYATRSTTSDWLLRFGVAPSSGLQYAYCYWIYEWA